MIRKSSLRVLTILLIMLHINISYGKDEGYTPEMTAFEMMQIVYPSFMDRKTPDALNDLYDFKLESNIQDYSMYNFNLIAEDSNTKIYYSDLSQKELKFLDTYINSVYLSEYDGKVCEVLLCLEGSANKIVNNLFRDEKEIVFSKYKYDERNKYFPTVSSYVRDDLKSRGLRGGYYHKYKSEKKILEYVEYFQDEYYDFNKYGMFDYPPGETSILTLGKYRYWEENKYTQQHYKSFLSDFNLQEQPINTDKMIYKIPLFEINNTYYIRALFGDFIDNIIFDTGADQLIISKNLYNKLKANNLVLDNDTSMKMQTATGDTIDLKRVILKSIQLNDLRVNNVAAYINTSDDISLLGQSFLKRFGKITIDHKLNLLTIEK